MRQLAIMAGFGTYGYRRVFGWEHDETIPTLLYANALAPHLSYESGEALRQACIEWRARL